MWINNAGQVYEGDCRVGDREATADEVAAWESSRINSVAGDNNFTAMLDRRKEEAIAIAANTPLPAQDRIDAILKLI